MCENAFRLVNINAYSDFIDITASQSHIIRTNAIRLARYNNRKTLATMKRKIIVAIKIRHFVHNVKLEKIEKYIKNIRRNLYKKTILSIFLLVRRLPLSSIADPVNKKQIVFLS